MNEIYRSSTPTFNFCLPIKVSEIDSLQFTMVQNGVTKITKQKSDCTLSGKKISFDLTSTETSSLDEGQVQVQLIVTCDDKRIPSRYMYFDVKEILGGNS